MNIFDFIIIYLACGAPFGVYYFLQNRNNLEKKYFYLKIIFNFLFWVPIFFKTVARIDLFRKLFDSVFDQKVVSDAKTEQEIFALKKNFETHLRTSLRDFSVFEFREIFDRYVGLSLELLSDSPSPTDFEKNFYQSFAQENLISEKCFHRLNLKRLEHHQNLARRDFLSILKTVANKSVEQTKVIESGLKLAALLKDFKIISELNFFFQQSFSNQNPSKIEQSENDLCPAPIMNAMIINNSSPRLTAKD